MAFATLMENRVRAARRAADPMDEWDVSQGRRIIRRFRGRPTYAPFLVPPAAVRFVEIAEEMNATPLIFRDWHHGAFELEFVPDCRGVLPRLMARAGFTVTPRNDKPIEYAQFRASAGSFRNLDERDAFLRAAWRYMESRKPRYVQLGEYVECVEFTASQAEPAGVS